MTKRDVFFAGYNFSYNRKESAWQYAERTMVKNNENRRKYPWDYNY
jgi:hypothetical protein